MIWTQTTDDHLFVFWNGQLIYKTWRRGLGRGQGVVLNNYGLNSWNYDDYWNADHGFMHRIGEEKK